MKRTYFAGLLLVTASAASTPAMAADKSSSDNDLRAEISQLQGNISKLNGRIIELEKKEGENWLTEQRAEQIKAIVQDVIKDAKARGTYLDSGLNVGYDNGFFIRTEDRNFTAKFNGFIQYRYTYEIAHQNNPGAFPKAPANKGGDANGFDFRYLRLTADGNVFTPNLTYVFTGDFGSNGNTAGASSTGGVGATGQTGNNFQLIDGFFAYRFNDMLNVRAGAFITPYSRALYIASGLQFIDFAHAFRPFNQDRGTGVSVFGDLLKDKLTYELNVNNGGKNDNQLGRAADSSSTGQYDNRLSFATRECYYGGTGTPADFQDESDLRKDTSTFAWMVGAAGVYDSANSSSGAFPAAQAGESIVGVGTNTAPGFGNYPLNGDIYRATIDGSFKYCGFAFTGATFFEQINENPAAAGQTLGTFPSGYSATNKSSFFLWSYYGQVGYMLNKQWEVVARAGNTMTEGSPNASQEYALGLNYYIFGKNVKIQTDVTYDPCEAAFTDTTLGTTQNTEDLTYRLQLQVKF